MSDPINLEATLHESFEAQWLQEGPVLSASGFLADHPVASLDERLQVVLTDQLLRGRSGSPKSVSDYLVEHPVLNDNPDAILKLIQGEFLTRIERGEIPETDAYVQEFPDLALQIRLQCEVDAWLNLRSASDESLTATVGYPTGDADDGARDEDQTDDGSYEAKREPTLDQAAPLREADFQVARRLGSGGMGEVYEAIQKSLYKRVALKIIKREALDSPSRVRRFLAEARALARLRHPRIVGVHGIGQMADGRCFLVMDLVEGGTTLADLIAAGAVPFDRAAELVRSVAEAIEHAHSRGVVHRDLKPANVLLDAEGNPHVTDFGLAKVFDTTDRDHAPTTAEQILGTPHYMTPEQADPARGPITPRTDVYALGGLLYALLTGKPPIQGESLTAILTQLVSPEPVRSPRTLRADIPAELERICRTCLEKDAANRLVSAVAVASALRSWMTSPDPDAGAYQASPLRPGDAEPIANQNVPAPTASGRPSSASWIPDRSRKAAIWSSGRDGWPVKSASTAGHRRRLLLVGTSAVTVLAVLIMVVPMIVQSEYLGLRSYISVGASGRQPLSPPTDSRSIPRRDREPVPLHADHLAKIAVRLSAPIINAFREGSGSIAIVLDCSGSMVEPKTAPKFQQAVSALDQVLRQVPAGTNVSLWTFGQLPDKFRGADGNPRLPAGLKAEYDMIGELPESTIERLRAPAAWANDQADALIKSLRSLRPWFGTPLFDAMSRAASEDLTTARGLKTLLVLTDGMDDQIEKYAVSNPKYFAISDFVSGRFESSGIRINMVFFTPAGAPDEIQKAKDNFEPALKRLDPPGSFVTADDISELKQMLRRGIEQKLTCQILKPDGTPVSEEALDVTLPGELANWSKELAPGIYTLRIHADKAYEQEVRLAAREQVVFRVVERQGGGIEFERILDERQKAQKRP